MADPGSVEDLMKRAALRREKIEKLKKAASEEVSANNGHVETLPTPVLPTGNVKENHGVTTVQTFGFIKSATTTVASGTPNAAGGTDHMKNVFANLADAYRSVDEEDSLSDSMGSSACLVVRRSSNLTKSRPSASMPKSPSASSLIKGNSSPGQQREKREHITCGDSPRLHGTKIMKPEGFALAKEGVIRGSPKKPDPAELSLQDRRALFEKSDAVQKSPTKAAGIMDSVGFRRTLFQEAAAKAQDPSASATGGNVNLNRNIGTPKIGGERPAPELEALTRPKATIITEPPKEVGTFTRTLQDKLLHQTQAWKQNEVSRKIEEQKEEDMKVLKQRWELMAEEEKNAAERQQTIEKLLEKRRAGGKVAQVEKPHPLPLPGTSALHEVHLKSVSGNSEAGTPKFINDSLSGAVDAVQRFDKPSLRHRTDVPPPPPPPPIPIVTVPGKMVGFICKSHRQMLPEEEGISGRMTDSSEEDRPRFGEMGYEEELESDVLHQVSYPAPVRSFSGASRGILKRGSGGHPCYADDSSDESYSEEPSPQKRSSFHRGTFPGGSVYVDDQQSETQSETCSSAKPISLSFYRKSQKETGSAVKQVLPSYERKNTEAPDSDDARRSRLAAVYQQKIDALYGYASQQHAILVQTTSALNLCRTAPEFQGSGERAECERLLLLAAKKREAYHTEISRLKAVISQMSHGSSMPDHGCHGTVTISNIILHTKEGFVEHADSDVEMMHYFVIVIKHRDVVVATQMVNSVQHLEADGSFHFPQTITFEDLESGFVLDMEVYAVQARRETVSHEEKYHIKEKAKKKDKGLTLKKVLPALKNGSATHMTMGTPSKQEIRVSSFGCVGFYLLSLQAIHGDIFMLSKVPEHSALEGSFQMNIKCGVALESTEEGFLTIFEDVCGPSAWHRRWCMLKNDSILMWKYPEERGVQDPQVLNLRWCKGEAEAVSPTVCARPHTFQLVLNKALKLSGEPKERGPFKYLLSADGKEERFIWCEKVNKVLTYIRAWIPNEKSARS